MSGISKGKSIPSWQQQQAPLSQTPDTKASNGPTTPLSDIQTVHESGGSAKEQDTKQGGAQFSKHDSIEEVRKFLNDSAVRDAPDDKKRSFLVGKGVDSKVIEEVLLEQKEKASTIAQQVEFDIKEFTARQPQDPPPAPPRDTPPIVTYPEFLVKPQKPPPLVTINRLLNTAYIAGGLATTFYGVSKYIIEPMTASLTEARHDFAEHSNERVQTLNERLSTVVSKIPPSKPAAAYPDTTSEVDSITSDPTELFHRDIGVQTSPSLSRRPSIDSSLADTSAQTAAEKSEERLRLMRSHLDDILDSEVSARESNGKLETSVGDLREYLNGLFFAPQRHVEYGVWQSKDPEDKSDDAVVALRSEIRGVKGMLLSARRFPAGTAAAAARVGA